MIKAVFLDIDNTILDFDAYVKDALESGFRFFSLGAYTENVYETFSCINIGLWRELEKGDLTMKGLFDIRFQRVFDALGISFDGRTFEKYFTDRLFDSAIPVDGAMELVRYLKKKYILSTASNGPHLQQVNRMRLSGMAGYFDHLFISESVGASKPSRAFFDHCLSKINEGAEQKIRPEETVMIGDSLTSDVMGAKNAGMISVYFDKQNKGKPADFAGDYYIASLDELFSIL